MMLLLAFSTQNIAITVIAIIAIGLAICLTTIFITIKSRVSALKSIEIFQDNIITAKQIIDIKFKYKIKALIYSSEIITSTKVNVAFNTIRIDNGLIFIEEILDLKKIKNEKPIKPIDSIIEINEKTISFISDSISETYFWNEVFYIKGHYAYNKNALFLKLELYKSTVPIVFQVSTFEDIDLLNQFKINLIN